MISSFFRIRSTFNIQRNVERMKESISSLGLIGAREAARKKFNGQVEKPIAVLPAASSSTSSVDSAPPLQQSTQPKMIDESKTVWLTV